ncbi:NAD kinase [Fulvivirgaceae bacterium LMO-SS25]
MKIAIHGRSLKSESLNYVQDLFDELHQRKVQILISQSFHEQLLAQKDLNIGAAKVYHERSDLNKVSFFFSLGGDGTLLDSITHVRELEIPIVGINTGRLGFLATTPRDQTRKAINDLFNNAYSIDKRTLVKVESDRELFGGINFGLNEVTILKTDTSSMITVHTYINGEYLNSYWADGLIIATPTGSTGYSLSCGGPLVLPQSSNFVITPVSPHNLTVRPMVVSDASVISFEVECRLGNAMISVDSRSQVVDISTPLAVRKENFSAKLVKFDGYSFFDTLRQKLNWGLDARN